MEVNTIKKLEKESVHWVSLHSYTLYFVLFLVGIAFDLIFKLKFVSDSVMVPFGIILLSFATFLILWTEHTTRYSTGEHTSRESFCKGPYCYTRSPIHWGLFILMLGFGVVINAFFVIIFTIISFLIGKLVFQTKIEKILERKYGIHYTEYKKLVRF